MAALAGAPAPRPAARAGRAGAERRTPAARGKPTGVLSVAYARNGLLSTIGRDNSLRLWKTDGNQLAKLEGFTDTPWRVVFSHDGERVIAGDFTGELHVWSVKDQTLIGKLSTQP